MQAGRSRAATEVRAKDRALERPRRSLVAVGVVGGIVVSALMFAVVAVMFRQRTDQSTEQARAGSTPSARSVPEGGSAVAAAHDAARSPGTTDSTIAVSAKSRGDGDSKGRAKSAAVLGISLETLSKRANRATTLVEVCVGKGDTSFMRTGTAFCVDTSGLFVTHADVVSVCTELKGQVRLLIGDGLEARTVLFPTIVCIDDETSLALLQIEPGSELRLDALKPAETGAVSPGATVVVFGFDRGQQAVDYDSQGQVVLTPPFTFYYGPPWNKEPPDHRIDAIGVHKVWSGANGLGAFDFPIGGVDIVDPANLSSGAPVVNAAGEVVGIITRPDGPSIVKGGLGAAHYENTPRFPVRAIVGFHGALSVDHLTRLLERARQRGSIANAAKSQNERLAAIKKGKSATALVEVSTRLGQCSGTAFCIDKSGLFITNAHVIQDTSTDARYVVNLVMDVGLPTQRKKQAEVVRADKKVDLALLKTESDPQLEALDLGTDGDLAPTMMIAALGFPFGKRLSGGNGASNDSYPDVTVNLNRLTSLDHDQRGGVTQLRFDGQLNPGNSGGPVVDARAKVIGVARATILGASINFAIPVGQLREFLGTPGLQVRFMPLAFKDRARPTTWTIQVVPSQFAKLPENMEVSVTVPDGANPPRKLWAQPTGGEGAFKLEFVAMPRDPGRAVSLAVRFGDRTEHPVVEDQDLTIGGRKLRLGAIRHLVVRPNPWAYVTDAPVAKGPILGPGKVVKGSIAGLGKVMALEGGKRKSVDLGAATEFTVIGVEPVSAAEVAAVIEVHKGGKAGTVVCGSRARLQISDESAPMAASPGDKPAPAAPYVRQPVERTLTLVTRTIPEKARGARLRLADGESMFRIGGELDVAGTPRGLAKAIRPPRAVVPKALALNATEAGGDTRELDVPAPQPEPGHPAFAMRHAAILGACFSPDGTRLAMGLQESIRVYDVAGGRLTREVDQPHATQLSLSANGSRLWSFSSPYSAPPPGNKMIAPRGPFTWDLKTGTKTTPLPIPGIEDQRWIRWISFESRFVWTWNTGIKFWDKKSGELRLSLQEDQHQPLASKTANARGLPNPVVTADGKRLLSFYAPKRAARSNSAPAPVPGKRAIDPPPVGAASLAKDPSVATSLKLHDIETGRLRFEMDYAGMTFLGLAPDTNTCVCEAADGTISFRDLKTGHELRRVMLRPNPSLGKASPLDHSPRPLPENPKLTTDGKQLIKPIWERGFGLFDLGSGAEVARFNTSESPGSWPYEKIELAPSGRAALVYRERKAHLWTLPSPALAPSEALARKSEPPLVRELGGTATAMAVGGAGRYLLLTLGERQLVVFDTNTADIVKRIPLDSENVLVAAGATKFVIAYPGVKRFERWDLGTFQRDGDAQSLPFDGTLEAIALGADSDGPLLAAWWFPHADPAVKDMRNNRLSFVDLGTFKVLAVGAIALHGLSNTGAGLAASGGDFELIAGGWAGQTRIRASYDGSLFGISSANVDGRSPPELAIKADAGTVTVSRDPLRSAPAGTPAYVIPSPDGRRVFHGKTGVRESIFMETPLGALGRQQFDPDQPLRFPTTDPRFDISLRAADTITFIDVADGRKFVSVAGLDEMAGVLQQGDIVRDGISLEHRYHVVPAATLLVTIPPTNDRLVVRRLELNDRRHVNPS